MATIEPVDGVLEVDVERLGRSSAGGFLLGWTAKARLAILGRASPGNLKSLLQTPEVSVFGWRILTTRLWLESDQEESSHTHERQVGCLFAIGIQDTGFDYDHYKRLYQTSLGDLFAFEDLSNCATYSTARCRCMRTPGISKYQQAAALAIKAKHVDLSTTAALSMLSKCEIIIPRVST